MPAMGVFSTPVTVEVVSVCQRPMVTGGASDNWAVATNAKAANKIGKAALAGRRTFIAGSLREDWPAPAGGENSFLAQNKSGTPAGAFLNFAGAGEGGNRNGRVECTEVNTPYGLARGAAAMAAFGSRFSGRCLAVDRRLCRCAEL